ncbi:MAG: hypothetical protein HY814_10310 [Candidatus Riflebacteria bacterium]|nr:hypothetical protein [Candidatus Riflebacteria bacterium]
MLLLNLTAAVGAALTGVWLQATAGASAVAAGAIVALAVWAVKEWRRRRGAAGSDWLTPAVAAVAAVGLLWTVQGGAWRTGLALPRALHYGTLAHMLGTAKEFSALRPPRQALYNLAMVGALWALCSRGLLGAMGLQADALPSLGCCCLQGTFIGLLIGVPAALPAEGTRECPPPKT